MTVTLSRRATRPAPKAAQAAPVAPPPHDPDRRGRCLSRVRDVPDAGGSDAAVDAPHRISRQPLLVDPRLQHGHVPWQGCSLHDLIQPAFSFLVGAALPFSILIRRARGETFQRLLGHAIWRSVALILLGIFLRSLERQQTYWTFEDTLTQIGLGYTFLFFIAFASLRVQIAVFVTILVAFWARVCAVSATGSGLRLHTSRRAGELAESLHRVPRALQQELEPVVGVRRLVPESFPRQSPFRFNGGGWSTLSFIPTLATMMLGLWAGRWLQTTRSTEEKLKGLVVAGVALTLAGLVFQWLHIVPIVKRIWTSSYTLYSGGLVVLILAAFYALIEWKGWRRWSFPLLVIGANSIAIYVMSWTIEHFISSALVRHLGRAPFAVMGPPFEPVLRGAAVLVVFWMILFWMYRRKIFLRI